ncbi:MAG: flagellar basal body P-ring protein FlgI [Fuerstiella sp.]
MNRIQTPLFRLPGLSVSVRLGLAVAVTVTSMGCTSSLLNLSGNNALSTKFRNLVKGDPETAAMEAKAKAKDKDDNNFETKIETPLLGDYVSVSGNSQIPLRGVGLVTGLNGTGGDPPPSNYRTELINEMKRRKVPSPQKILASRDTAMVIVTGYLPAMVEKGQHFDVRVVLPPNSTATSLKGGWLLDTRLAEERAIRGAGVKKGHHDATAGGAILTALGADGSTKASPALLRRGSVPGGAVSKTERNLEIIIRNERRSIKTAKNIETAISKRLFHYDRFGQRTSMASAKTDMMVELKVHPLYRNNYPRYRQMIGSIAFREGDVARRLRMERLAKEILEPATAKRSAYELEAIGRDAIPFLKAALASPELEVQFHAALALAYLEDVSGVEFLKEAAIKEPAFRAYALAALSITTDADSVLAMRELLSDDVLETRYGAVRALKENSPNDPSLGTSVFPNQFIIHAVESSGPAAVHVVRYRFPEVVVFGTQQELAIPATLSCGHHLRVMGKNGDNTVTVTRYVENADPIRRKSSPNLVEVLKTLASMGATYPDVVQLLLEAENQNNLAGELGVDRLPQAGRAFYRTKSERDGAGKKRAKLGSAALTPGLFDRVEESDIPDAEKEESALERMFREREATDEPDMAGGSFEDGQIGDDQMVSKDMKSMGMSDSEMDESESDMMSDQTAPEEKSSLDLDIDLSEPESEEDFVLEQTEFREPFAAKLKRVFRNPFKKDADL